MAYDDGKFGVIERHWFGLPIVMGGQAANPGMTFNETEAWKVKRHYPKGPIQLVKCGVLTCSTLGKGEELFRLSVDTTLLQRLVASTTSPTHTIASYTLNKEVEPGSYLTLLASTNVCSTGAAAVFIEFRRKFHQSKWDPAS